MKFIEIIGWFLTMIVGVSLAQEPCQTPSKAPGTCISLKECAYLFNIVESGQIISASDREYLRQHQCGFDGRRSPKVCCAPGTRYTINNLPVPSACGLQPLADRLFGGENTTIFEYPWMALLEYRKYSTTGFHCGGVIINENYILTAAHCISGEAVTRNHFKLISVRLGEHNLLTDPDCTKDECALPVVNIPVAETIVHENYNPSSLTQNDDIALIRVIQSIIFSDSVKPICLPVSEKLRTKNMDAAPMVIVGFGKTENQSSSDVKLRLDVNGTSLQQCNEAYRKFNINISTKQLCAGGEDGKVSCNGDSGSPLMILDGIIPYTYLAGIVSFGPRACGTKDVPGVHTKVDQYIDWIVNHMRQ